MNAGLEDVPEFGESNFQESFDSTLDQIMSGQTDSE